jgi:large subunit ribosomal protein L29
MAKRRSEHITELKQQARDWTPEEAVTKDRELTEQLFQLRFRLASGQGDVLRRLRELRRDVARVKTIRRERDGVNPAPVATTPRAASQPKGSGAAVPKKTGFFSRAAGVRKPKDKK